MEEATTPSLEALKAYSLGAKTLNGGDFAAAVPLLERAVRLDPNFAMAYGLLGMSYHNLGENTLAEENTRKAYELSERVSEREKLMIESFYYQYCRQATWKRRAKTMNSGRRPIRKMTLHRST